jgi:hypothetical protein
MESSATYPDVPLAEPPIINYAMQFVAVYRAIKDQTYLDDAAGSRPIQAGEIVWRGVTVEGFASLALRQARPNLPPPMGDRETKPTFQDRA